MNPSVSTYKFEYDQASEAKHQRGRLVRSCEVINGLQSDKKRCREGEGGERAKENTFCLWFNMWKRQERNIRNSKGLPWPEINITQSIQLGFTLCYNGLSPDPLWTQRFHTCPGCLLDEISPYPPPFWSRFKVGNVLCLSDMYHHHVSCMCLYFVCATHEYEGLYRKSMQHRDIPLVHGITVCFIYHGGPLECK